MIAFELSCSQGHTFEGWFDSTEAFENQKTCGLVSCPICGDEVVSKVISPIRSLKGGGEEAAQPAKALRQAVKTYLDKNFENVGTDFAKEALKIHYGAAPERNIRGSSTLEEEKDLQEEGIVFFKVNLPEDLN